MRFRYPIPDTEQDFEVFCLRVLRRHWVGTTLELYGKRGEGQFGVDIFDVGGGTPLRAAQCKHKEIEKKLSRAAIIEEVQKARHFPHKLGLLLIITTGSRSTATQNVVVEINREHADQGLFQVQVVGWDWIEDLLDQYPELVDQLYPKMGTGAAVSRAQFDGGEKLLKGQERILEVVARIAQATDSAAADRYDADLDEARDLIQRGEHQSARVLLSRLDRVSWADLSPHQRFRLKTNLAACLAQGGDRLKAASLLLEAAACEPHTQKSMVNRAVAYELRGETEIAYAAAVEARESFPESGGALAVLLRNLPESIGWPDVKELVPEGLTDEEDVALAMAHRAMSVEAFDEAADWAQRAAARQGQNYAYAMLIEARALLESERRNAHYLDGLPVVARPGRIERASSILSDALEVPGIGKGLVAEVLVRRASARELLGETSGARRDLLEAEHLAPNEPLVLLANCDQQLVERNWDAAVDRARRAVAIEMGPLPSYYLGRALWLRDRGTDRAEATGLFKSLVLSRGHLPLRMDAAEKALRGLASLGRTPEGWQLLEELPHDFDRNTHGVLRATFASMAEDRERATEAIEELLGAEPDTGLPPEQRRLVVRVLVWLRRDQDALPLLESLCVPGELSDDVHELLDCAHRLGRDDLVLRIASELRKAGVRHPRLLNNELSLLARYAPSEALEVLTLLVAEEPTDREARLDLSLLALQLGRDELVFSDLEMLPEPSLVTPLRARGVVEVLQRSGKFDEAKKYAYAVLRRCFDDPDAHRAYISVFLWEKASPEDYKVSSIAAGAAVLVEDDVADTRRWLVLEPSVDLRPQLDEVSLDDPIAKAILGHSVGNIVAIAKGRAQDRLVRIVEVLDKYVFRFQDCMNQWQVRFPEERGVEMVRLARKGSGDESEQLDFGPLLKMAKDNSASVEESDNLYRNNPITLWVLGRAGGGGVVRAFDHVLASENLQLHCCSGAAGERERAHADVDGASGIVLDISALLAIEWLDLGPILADWPTTLIVPHGIAALVRDRAIAEGHSHARGTAEDPAQLNDGGGAAGTRFGSLLRFLQENCAIVDCPELAKLAPHKRKELIQYTGAPTAQAIVVAATREVPLWTDERIVALIGEANCGVRHVWTQAVLHARQAAGGVESRDVAARVAKLLAARYVVTHYDVATVVASASLADWNPGRSPLKQLLDQMIGDGARFHPTIEFALKAIVGLCTEAATTESRTAVVVAILDRIAAKPNGLSAIAALEHAVPLEFGLNVVRGAEVREIIKGWLSATSLG